MSHHVDDRGQIVFAVTLSMIIASSCFVLLRLVSRLGVVRKIASDDYFIVLAWSLAFGLSVAICFGSKHGLGRHEYDVSPNDKPTVDKASYAFTVLYNPTLMATRTSILVFYLSLSRTQKIFRWLCIGTLVAVNVGGLALSLLNIFVCRPMSALFKYPKPESAHCTNIVVLYLSSAPLNIITDLVILLLPMPILKSMRLPKKQKIILFITFGFGIFVTAVDVVRIAYLQSAALYRLQGSTGAKSNTGNPDVNDESDFSWYASLSFMWSAIECNVGIMCACVPALKPLVSRFIPRMLHSQDDSVADKDLSQRFATSQQHQDEHRVSQSSGMIPAIKPTTPSQSFEEAEMGMMDFLTTPDSPAMPSFQRSQTAMTNSSMGGTLARSSTFFDFVDIRRHKGIVNMTAKESIVPIAKVTILFFLWGFAYGLLNALNMQFQAVTNMSAWQTIGFHSAYYGGYLIAPLTFGRLLLKSWGFKSCYMVGLMIYGVGTLIFWPAAVLASFPAFLISNLIVGLGLSTLEIAANPFIALCGPPKYAHIRLNLSQGFQACGTIFSSLLAKKTLFKDIKSANSLVDVQWTYLAITLFTFILAFVYYCIELPEVTDDELEQAADRTHGTNLTDLRLRIVWITLVLGAFSEFLYVGSQEAVSTSLGTYIKTVRPGADEVNYEAVGHTLFAVSRFLAAFLAFFMNARYILAAFFSLTIAFTVLAMHFSGTSAAVMVMGIYFFEGPLFAFIFTFSLQGLGRHTKDAAALLTACISGGAAIQPIMHAVFETRSIQYSYCVPVATLAFAALFPIYLILVPKARLQADAYKSAEQDGEQSQEQQLNEDESRKPKQSLSTDDGTKVFGSVVRRSMPRYRSSDDIVIQSEHVEKCPPNG